MSGYVWFDWHMANILKRLSVAGILGLLLFGFAWAGGNKNKAVVVSFHVETEANDHPNMIFSAELGGKKRVFRRMPEITSKDFVAFTPFPSEDQQSYGALIQLKNTAATRLSNTTTVNTGKWLAAQAFGRIVDGVIIEDPVNDGKIMIWKGLTLEEVGELDKLIPRIGEEE